MYRRKQKLQSAVIAVLLVFAVAFVPVFAAIVKDMITAEAGVMDELQEEEVAVPVHNVSKNHNKDLGSAANPFIVLEIVPFEAYAEIGYLIEGCEPIDFEKAKYVGSLTNANNLLADVNSIIGGTPFSVKEIKKHVDYYRNDNTVAGEDYPEGYLDSSVAENCYGYFEKVTDGSGKFNISGNIDDMSLTVQYCGSGGSYNFVIEAVKTATAETAEKDYPEVSEEYLEQFGATRMQAGAKSITVSTALSEHWSGGKLYAYFDGVYGCFESANGAEALYQISGSAGNKDLTFAYCGGNGNYRFVEKETNPEQPYDNFDGLVERTIYRVADGASLNIKIANNSPEPWSKIYAEYNGAYGYFSPDYSGNGTVQFPGTLTVNGWTRAEDSNEQKYSFTESAEAVPYFNGEKTLFNATLSYQLCVANATLNYTKNDAPMQDTIQISYANSTSSQIYAVVHYYAALEYHYDNANYFLKNCLMIPEEEIEDYHIQVITVTPETLDANQGLIAAADYINITDAPHVMNMPKVWSQYYRESLFSPSAADLAEAAAYGSAGSVKRSYLEHDLSWAVTLKLLAKISTDDGSIPYAPMSIAVTCYQGLFGPDPYSKVIPTFREYSDGCVSNYGGTGTINNFAKLYMMLTTFEAEDDVESGYFYKNYIETGLVKETTVTLNGKTVTTGYFDSFIQEYGDTEEVRTAALYWNPYTFLKIEEHDISEVENHTHETGEDPAKLYEESNMIDINGGEINSSVRNNVFTYNSDCSLTQHVIDETFGFEEGDYHEEPFSIIEFSERDQLAPVDIIYYLLNQGRNSLSMYINGSNKNQIWANVDYDSEAPETAIAGEIINKDGKLYGRVHFNVALTSNKPVANSQIAITIYRDESYDDPATEEREDWITITEAYTEDDVLERIQLYKECYWDIPLELLDHSNTEDLKFSMKIYYRYKGAGDKGDTESYSMQKSLHEYKLDADGNAVKDNRRVLTFVRRALFDLE